MDTVLRAIAQITLLSSTFLETNAENNSTVEPIRNALKIIAISDTLVLMLPEKVEGAPITITRFAFLLLCSQIARSLFEDGLPVRGGLAFGFAVSHDHCFGAPVPL